MKNNYERNNSGDCRMTKVISNKTNYSTEDEETVAIFLDTIMVC